MLPQIPDSDGVQQLLNHMVEEDADRRAQESAGYIRGEARTGPTAHDAGYGRDFDDGGRPGYGHRPTAV